MQERHINRKLYFEEQAKTCEKFYIPYIDIILPVNNILSVLEIGCGDGGNLLPFAKRGIEITGVDIMEGSIKRAINNYKELDLKGAFIASDILKVESLDRKFDLIFMHDVIEHIYDKKSLLLHIKKFLKPGGVIFFGFPAWQMPFGGHQQICKNKVISHLPFVHLLPKAVYKGILSLAKENKDTIDELIDIKRCKITVEMFQRLANETLYNIVDKRLFLINPHYETKFGLKPRLVAKPFSGIPFFRNFYTTSCFFVIKPKE